MLLKIEIPSRYLCVPAVNAGPIMAALETSFAVDSEGYGKEQKWVKSESPIVVEFVSEAILKEAPEPIKKAMQNYEVAQRNWLDEYGKRTKLEAEVKALKEKLEAVNQAAATKE